MNQMEWGQHLGCNMNLPEWFWRRQLCCALGVRLHVSPKLNVHMWSHNINTLLKENMDLPLLVMEGTNSISDIYSHHNFPKLASVAQASHEWHLSWTKPDKSSCHCGIYVYFPLSEYIIFAFDFLLLIYWIAHLFHFILGCFSILLLVHSLLYCLLGYQAQSWAGHSPALDNQVVPN